MVGCALCSKPFRTEHYDKMMVGFCVNMHRVHGHCFDVAIRQANSIIPITNTNNANPIPVSPYCTYCRQFIGNIQAYAPVGSNRENSHLLIELIRREHSDL